MLTARRVAGGTANGTESLVASPPGGITTERRPPKYSERDVPGTAFGPLPSIATAASPTRSGALPNAFVSRTLSLTPPALVSTISRSVALRKPARDRFPAVAGWGLAPQLVIQWLPAGTGTGVAEAGASELTHGVADLEQHDQRHDSPEVSTHSGGK